MAPSRTADRPETAGKCMHVYSRSCVQGSQFIKWLETACITILLDAQLAHLEQLGVFCWQDDQLAQRLLDMGLSYHIIPAHIAWGADLAAHGPHQLYVISAGVLPHDCGQLPIRPCSIKLTCDSQTRHQMLEASFAQR